MTSLLSVRKRAEEFAAAVDGGSELTAINPDMRQLAGIAALLREQADAPPRPDFTTSLREALMVEAATVLTPANVGLALPVRARGTRERRLVAVAASVVLISGTASMAAASQGALPGEALYPIKRGIEQAQTGLSMSSAGKGRDLLNQANDRLDEVEGLLNKGSLNSGPQVPHTIDEFTQQANDGADLLMDSFQDTRDPAAIVAVRQFAADGITLLEGISATAPPEAHNELTAAAMALLDIDTRASELCTTCDTGLPELKVPEIFLASAEVDRVLRDASVPGLDNSHPVVVDRHAVTGATHTVGGTKSGTQSGTAAGSAATPSAPSSTPSAGLPGAKTPTKKGATDLNEVTKNPIGAIGDGLGGMPATLLPDSTTPPLP